MQLSYTCQGISHVAGTCGTTVEIVEYDRLVRRAEMKEPACIEIVLEGTCPSCQTTYHTSATVELTEAQYQKEMQS